MIHISKLLSHYKREDVQEAILENAQNREIAIKYEDKFGKRPDILKYKRDILEAVKQGATSFHASEELWRDPLRIDTIMKRQDLDELRIGWDLVLDIDCDDWEFSKLIAYLFIKALKQHNIKSVTCKFSGNRGFHIGVPFEAFPSEVAGKKTKDLFPEGPRRIARYLLDFISKNYTKIEGNLIIFDKNYSFSLDQIKEKFGDKEFILNECFKCKKKVDLKKDKINEFVCPKCEKAIKSEKKGIVCDKCNILMYKSKTPNLCKCGSNEYSSYFNWRSVIDIDTMLLSQRHLYRMPYCFNEKSELVSIPVDVENVLKFNKEFAKHPIKLTKYKFLDRTYVIKGEARDLIVQVFDYIDNNLKKEEEKTERYEDYTGEAIPEQFFPPCIKKLLEGMKDGKKRAMFILSNFLSCTGYNYDQIEKIMNEWNKKNKEKIRENYFIGQLRYFKSQNKKVPPPNCNNMMYYKDIGICFPDNLCSKIKNPVNYSRRKTYYLRKGKE